MDKGRDGNEVLVIDIEELGKDEVVLEWLIREKGFDVNARADCAPEHLFQKNWQIARDKNWPLLTLAAVANKPRLYALLIANGADIDAITNNADTALHWATGLGHDDCAVELVNLGARFDIVNGYQVTAWSLARDKNSTPKALELMQRMQKK